jgi:CHAT domain-containing protein
MALITLDKHKEALPHFERCRSIREQLYADQKAREERFGKPKEDDLINAIANWGRDYAATLVHLGIVCEALDRPKEAAAHYEKAVKTYRDVYPNGHPELTAALTYLGGFHASQGKADAGLEAYSEAIAILERQYPPDELGERHPDLAACDHSMGSLLRVTGKYEQAIPHLKRAFDCYQKNVRRYAAALSESEALAYLNFIPATRDQLLSTFHATSAGDEQAYDVVWRGKGTVTRLFQMRHIEMRARAANQDNKVGETWAELINARRGLSRLAHSQAADASRNEAFKELTERKERLEARLAELIPGFAQYEKQETASPTDLLGKLPEKTAFVDFLRYDRFGVGTTASTPHYVAFVLSSGGAVKRVELGEAKPIEQALTAWRHALLHGGDHPEAADLLRKLVWAPLAKHFSPDTEAVYIAPDGELARLPWAALPGSRDNEILLHDYKKGLAVVPHGHYLLDQLLHPFKPRDTEANFLAVGGVKFDPPGAPARPRGEGFYWLEGTALELVQIKRLAGDRKLVVLDGHDATARRFLQELPRAEMAHVGTHGFFNAAALLQERRRQQALLRSWEFRKDSSTPLGGLGLRSPLLYTGLALANANHADEAERGIVTGEMIVPLPLEGVRLVVLSACDTGVGDIRARAEGVQSLQWAFHVAGCRNVIASLWAVPDHKDTTPALMKKFYSELLKGAPPMEALRAAQLDQYANGPAGIEVLKRSAPTFKGGMGGSPDQDTPRQDPRNATTSTRWAWAPFILSGSGQ